MGSNLAVDGIVECDATIIDRSGRIGAVDAVQPVRNSIHLARLVLENSQASNFLNHVPPTLLCRRWSFPISLHGNSVLLVLVK